MTGIAEGPVMAGVISKKKYFYDVCGATVNLASRIESSCTPGKVCVSESVKINVVDDNLVFEEFNRSLKGFGQIRVFEVSHKTPRKCVDEYNNSSYDTFREHFS